MFNYFSILFIVCFFIFCVISRNKTNNVDVVIDRELISQFYDGTYEFDPQNESFTELEEGAVGGAVYDIYRMSIEEYNNVVSENNDGFGLIELRFKNVNRSLINTNLNYGKSGIGGDTILTIDQDRPPTGSDSAAGSLGVNVPIKIYMAKSVDTEVIDNTNITIDTVNTPNVIDKDIVVDTSNDPITSTTDTTNNIVKWTIPAIGESTTDLDILCLRSLTVTPLQFPYNFSIDSYNNDYNTNYIGIRNLTINNSAGSGIINISGYAIATNRPNTGDSFSNFTKYTSNSTYSYSSNTAVARIRDRSDMYIVSFSANNSAGQITIDASVEEPTYVFKVNTLYNYMYLYKNNNECIITQYAQSGRNNVSYYFKTQFQFNLQ